MLRIRHAHELDQRSATGRRAAGTGPRAPSAAAACAVNHHRTMNSTRPSSAASYSCEGWRTCAVRPRKPHGTVGRLAPQLAVDEIADAPEEQAERRQRRGEVEHVGDVAAAAPGEQRHGATSTPSSPPWKDMPPSQILSGYQQVAAPRTPGRRTARSRCGRRGSRRAWRRTSDHRRRPASRWSRLRGAPPRQPPGRRRSPAGT